MSNFISVLLPHDLPENWNDTQYVSPNGTEVGLPVRHGYNYLMQQVNNAQIAAVELSETLSSGDNNLLDNWYFLDPVNRNQGYCVFADTEYYGDEDLSIPIGVLSSHSNAEYVNEDYGTIILNGLRYYVAFTDMYNGYVMPTAGGFTFDRWWAKNAVVSKLKSAVEGFSLNTQTANTTASLRQAIPNSGRLVGRKVILSVFVSYMGASANVKLYKAPSVNSPASSLVEIGSKSLVKGLNTLVLTIPNDIGGTTYPHLLVSIETWVAGGVSITAAKLQLGTRQTLAYQDASNNWLLRDIPNKVIETLRCNGAPVDIGGQGMLVVPEDIGLSTANVLADAEIIDEEVT